MIRIMTNMEMFNAIQCISEANEIGKLGYALARNLRKLTNECKDFLDWRDKLLIKYGEHTGEGHYQILPEKQEDFRSELKELEGISHDVDIYQIPESLFTSGHLTTKQMYALDWMVKEEE